MQELVLEFYTALPGGRRAWDVYLCSFQFTVHQRQQAAGIKSLDLWDFFLGYFNRIRPSLPISTSPVIEYGAMLTQLLLLSIIHGSSQILAASPASVSPATVPTAVPNVTASLNALLPSQAPLPPKQAWCPSDIFCAGSVSDTLLLTRFFLTMLINPLASADSQRCAFVP